MSEVVLAAEKRSNSGSSASGRLRAEGKIPAVVYGHGIDPVAVAVRGRELRAALTTEAGVNALINLNVGSNKHLVLTKELQRHPVKGTVSHVDFVVVRRDEVVSADVPITLVNEAEDVRKNDGVVEHVLFSLTVHATPDKIPPHLEVDIASLQVGEAIRVSDLKLPVGVTTEVDPDESVVIAKHSTVSADVETADEEAASTVAAGEASPDETPDGAPGDSPASE